VSWRFADLPFLTLVKPDVRSELLTITPALSAPYFCLTK
jgi:hypothetical protein